MRQTPKITAKQVLHLVEAQHYRCAISGRKLTPQTASLDHIVPLCHGGEHAVDNVWVVDHQVNTAKGTLRTDEFVDLCRDVVAHQSAEPNETEAGSDDRARTGPPPQAKP